jgi:hypothetical protein
VPPILPLRSKHAQTISQLEALNNVRRSPREGLDTYGVRKRPSRDAVALRDSVRQRERREEEMRRRASSLFLSRASEVGPAPTRTRSGSCSCVQQRRGGRSGCTRDAANARGLCFFWWMDGIGSVRRIASHPVGPPGLPSSSSLLILWPCCASLSSHGGHCRIPAVILRFHSRSLDLPAASFVAWYCAILTDRVSLYFFLLPPTQLKEF